MASENDLPEMLRILTMRKVTMIAAMGYIKTLQAKNLKSIEQIAEAPLAAVEEAIGDARLAKSFRTACVIRCGKKSNKRAAEEPAELSRKRRKSEDSVRNLDYSSLTPDELEGMLSLPLCEDEQVIRETTLVTNRAPLALAFALELLRFTMPEQPLSSRLSLAEAMVSSSARTKAISIGIEKASADGESSLPTGQTRVSVMGRSIPVLKRSGYSWSENSDKTQPLSADGGKPSSSSSTLVATSSDNVWQSSKKLTSRNSTFVAYAAPITSPSKRAGLMKTLFNKYPDLEKTADHVAWAMRTSFGESSLVQEASFDDGEAGCGKFMLDLLREANITNTTVVLVRWYGGVMLGPGRWRLMRECLNDALSAQHQTSTFSGEAVWGLETSSRKPVVPTIGMAIHRPEDARNYLLRSFPSEGSPDSSNSSKNWHSQTEEKRENLGRLLGALRLLFTSWAGVLDRDELNRRADSWYQAVRPVVREGYDGWGEKKPLKLSQILDLRRAEAPKGRGIGVKTED